MKKIPELCLKCRDGMIKELEKKFVSKAVKHFYLYGNPFAAGKTRYAGQTFKVFISVEEEKEA